jgi:hypothetical protein
MKTLRGARFENAEYYFRKGVSFSPTGSTARPFGCHMVGYSIQRDHAYSMTFFEPEFLLGVQSSTFIQNTSSS